MSDSILKQVVKGLGQITTETAEKTVEHVGEIGSSIITGQELLGINPMSDEDLAKKKAEDEQNKQREIDQMMAKIPGRNVETEMKQVEQQEDQIEQQKRKEEQQQRQAQQEMISAPLDMESSNPQKRKKKRGSALGGGKKKTNLPDPASMSQTSEKAGKME